MSLQQSIKLSPFRRFVKKMFKLTSIALMLCIVAVHKHTINCHPDQMRLMRTPPQARPPQPPQQSTGLAQKFSQQQYFHLNQLQNQLRRHQSVQSTHVIRSPAWLHNVGNLMAAPPPPRPTPIEMSRDPLARYAQLPVQRHQHNSYPSSSFVSDRRVSSPSQHPSSHYVAAASERAQQVLAPARPSAPVKLSTIAATSTTSKPMENQPADRENQRQFHQWRDPNGKLLICYYATKQTAPYWPKEAREFVVPAEQLTEAALDFYSKNRASGQQAQSSRGGNSLSDVPTENRLDQSNLIANNKQQQQRRRSVLPDVGGRVLVIAPEFALNQSIKVGARSNSLMMMNSNEIGIDRADSLAQLFQLANNWRRTIADRQDNGATIAANQSIVRQLAPLLAELNFAPNNDQVGGIVFDQNKFKHDLSQNNNRQLGGRPADGQLNEIASGQETTSVSEHPQRPIVTTTISTPMLHNIPNRNAPTRRPEHAPKLANGDRSQLPNKANNPDQQLPLSPYVGRAFIVSTTLSTFPSPAFEPTHQVGQNQNQNNIDKPHQATGPMPTQNSEQQNKFYYSYNIPTSSQSAQAQASTSVGVAGSSSPGPGSSSSQSLLTTGGPGASLSSYRPANLNQQQRLELSGTTLNGFNSNAPVQRGKSLQLSDWDSHFKPAPTMQTSGSITSATSGLGHPSSLLPSSVTLLPAANSPTSSHLAQSSPAQANQQPVERLIVSNRPKSSPLTATASSTVPVGQHYSSLSLSSSDENSENSAPDPLKVSAAAAASSNPVNGAGESLLNGKTTPAMTSLPSSDSSFYLSTATNPSESTPSSGLSIKLDEQLASAINRNYHAHQSPTSIKQTTVGLGGGNSLSAALVSSPLSTMFDVFGAASQYLMRFKPSSLISPASFAAFNSIGGDSHNKLRGNSSLPFGAASASASGGGHHHEQEQKSSPLLASIRNGSQVSSREHKGGFLSRLSQQLSLSHQPRREDICGRTIQTAERRIIGGEGAKYGEFPYQVHIKIAKHQCGGALVDRQSIVTAAHCVYHFITRAPVNKLQIVIGAYDIEDEQYQEQPPQYFKVNKVKLHPNFRFSASHPDRYDIAILKLDKPVRYTDNVLPVCLPGRELKYDNMVGTVTGFGKTDPSLSNRYGTRLLQKVDVPIIENSECERWHRTRGIDLKIFPEMMCAGYEDGLKDACVGDSGGPLVVKTPIAGNNRNEAGAFRWTLAGITSAGFGCAQSRQPGIYHRVSHTVDWILENLD